MGWAALKFRNALLLGCDLPLQSSHDPKQDAVGRAHLL
jgi:hypothetical protein